MKQNIRLGIGYTINEDGLIVGCIEDNHKKSIGVAYSEVVKFLLEEFAKSNGVSLDSIEFI
jgi:hypothetical protein